MGEQYPERRRWPRYSVIVECYIDGLSARAAVRLTELGMGGGYVDTKSPFAPGDPIGLVLILEGVEIAAKGQVVYVHAHSGFGFAFDRTDMALSTQKQIEDFLKRRGTSR
jgi:hypothetical protein